MAHGIADDADNLANRLVADESPQSAQSYIRQPGSRRLVRAVAERDVRDLVRNHSSQLVFSSRGFNHSAIDVNRTAGQGEGVDVRDIDHFETIGVMLALRLRGQRLTDAADVFVDARICEQRQLTLSFDHELPPDLDILLWREKVETRPDSRLRQSGWPRCVAQIRRACCSAGTAG